MSTVKTPPPKVQLNILLDSARRRKFKAIALAWDTTERELLEQFIDQLPDVTPRNVAAPAAVSWAKPPKP